MKIKIFLGLTIAVLVFILFFNVLNAGPGGPDEDSSDGHYWRYDEDCPNLPKQKTYCVNGGDQLCTPQYCN
jgi:hypothetical protein